MEHESIAAGFEITQRRSSLQSCLWDLPIDESSPPLSALRRALRHFAGTWNLELELDLDLKESCIDELKAPFSKPSKGRPTGLISGTRSHPMANTQSTGGYQDTEWTLILWDIENVAVPEQLRNARGIQALTAELKQQFATSRGKELHCIKLACHWSHPRSPYSDLLGSLTTLGDVEALSYQWQGHADKIHCADRMLKRAADRFMRLVERRGAGAPRHLVVFITSDADFSENIAQLQSRNFTVEVLYHNPVASKKPVSIIHVANKAHAWLPFLRHHLKNPSLSLTYDPSQFAPPRRQSPIRQANQQVSAPNAFRGPAAPSHPAMQRQTDGWLPSVSDSASSVTSSALVQVHGLVEGSPSIARRCEILLAQHISQQVADSTDITVLHGWNGPFAVLDFSKAHQPTQQAANAVAALDGKEWYSSKLHVQLYNDGSAASSSSCLPAVTVPAAPPVVAKPVVFVVPRSNNGPLVTGYNKTGDGHAHGHKGNGYGQGKHWGTKGNCRRGHQGANGCVPMQGQPASSTGQIRQGMEQQHSNRSAAAVDDIRDPSSSTQQWHIDSDVEAVGTIDHTSSPASRDPEAPTQKQQTASSGNDTSGDTEFQHEDSLGVQDADGGHEAYRPEGEVAWGFDSALDGEYELFTPDQCVPLEEQWNMLQCLDPEDQAISDHRYFDLVVDYQLCNIDLVEMLLSSEYGGDAACRSVWRQG